METSYKVDMYKDKTEDKKCDKSYSSKATITGGITHISCSHNIVKGFTALQRGERPLQVLGPALCHLPSRVKASQRFLLLTLHVRLTNLPSGGFLTE